MKSMYPHPSPQMKIMFSTLLVSGAFILAPSLTYASSKEMVKVKLGEIISVDNFADTFTLKLASSTLTVNYSDTTYTYDGEEKNVSLSEAVKKGQMVYVFGVLDNSNASMRVQKIVVKNPSKLSRKNLFSEGVVTSRNQQEKETFSLWLEIWKGITFTTVYSAERIESGFGYLQASSSGENSEEKISKDIGKEVKKEEPRKTISQYNI